MEEKFYTAEDGAKIAYYITGKGDPVLCVHGSGRNKEYWENTGWVDELKKSYTVIAMDVRGFGNSSVYHDPKFYQVDRICGDINGVLKECNVSETRYFGHSYGATIGFQAIRAGLPITKAVFASGSMGESFFHDVCPKAHAEYEFLMQVKRKNDYDQLTDYSKEDINFIKTEDMDKFSALFAAWEMWRPVGADELKVKVSMYSGTKDHNKEMVENTTEKQEYFKQYGIDTKCFDGLGHEELITKKDIVLPWVLEHLK